MPIPTPHEVPAIDFDLSSHFAGHKTIAVMCWPNRADRQRRLATIWADVADAVDDQFGAFLFDVRHTVAFHGIPPPAEALDSIIADCARDAAHRQVLVKFVEDLALPPSSDRNVSLAARFWARIITSPDWQVPPDRYIWNHLIQPLGGLRAIADSPGLDEVRDEISICIQSHPMLAGLSFYLIATIDKHHRDLKPSYNATYRIISATFDRLRVHSVDWQKRQIPYWHCVAPIWAGFLAEADCWLDDALLDIDELEGKFLEVFESDERRQHVMSYAAWFTNYIVSHQSDHIRRGRDRIIQWPETVQPLEPDRRPLTRRVLAAARRYR